MIEKKFNLYAYRSQQKKWLKLKAHIPNLVGERKEGEIASL